MSHHGGKPMRPRLARCVKILGRPDDCVLTDTTRPYAGSYLVIGRLRV